MEHGLAEGDVEAAVLERQLLAGRVAKVMSPSNPVMRALAGDLDASRGQVERRHLGAAPGQ